MIELLVVYALLADASSDHLPYPIPQLEYEDERRFETEEKIQDEAFFRSQDPNRDRNPYYFPDSTLPK